MLAWISMLLPWQHCHAPCHDRVELGTHDCHPDGRCPEKPGDESNTGRDDPLSFDTVQPRPEPVAAPPPVALPLAVASAPAPLPVAPVPAAPPAAPRTTVLLL